MWGFFTDSYSTTFITGLVQNLLSAGLRSLIKSWTANVWSSPTPAFNLKDLPVKTNLQHIYLQNTFGFIRNVHYLSVRLKNWALEFVKLTKPKFIYKNTHE